METIVDNETNSEGLVIFLFSNGQEFSPPRKYHLRHNDLHQWDATLRSLALSQYDSLHPVIELYTVEGVKVYDPIEICSGRAYVAVVPPDPFIDTGYNHYLIKASRSWEKRQMRKLSNLTDESTIANKITKIGALKSSRTPCPSLDTAADKTVRRTSIKNGATSKQIVKKKPLAGQVSKQENSSILRKSNSNSYPPASPSIPDKTTCIRRRQIVNKYSKTPKRTDKLVTSEKNKTTSKAPVTNTIPKIRKESVDADSITGKTTADNIAQKHEIKEHSVHTSVTEGTDIKIISNLYKNMESDNVSTYVDANSRNGINVEIKGETSSTIGPSLVVITAGLSFQKPNTFDKTNGINNVTSEATAESSIKKTNSTEVTSGVAPYTAPEIFNLIDTTECLTNFSDQKILLTNQPPETLTQNISLNEQSKDGQFIALTNKGDFLNLNVNIEIRNADVAVQAIPNVDTCKSRSLTGINKQDVNYNEAVTQSKSVQSLLIDYLPRLCCQDDQNLVYIQCACVDDSFRSNPKAVCPEIRPCFVLLPVLTRAEKQCCKCENNEGMKTPTKQARTSADLPEVVTSAIFIQTDQQGYCVNAIPATSQTEFVVDCISKCQFELCSDCGGKKINVCQSSTSRVATVQTEKKIETVSFLHNKKPTRNICDMGAQTDWCSTMLEARMNSDGHYTFHLPSIQKIKQYNYL